MIQSYNNIQEFAEELKTAETTKLFQCRPRLESQREGSKFSGVDCYEAADRLLLDGDKKSTELLTDAVTTCEQTNTGRATYRAAVAGCCPIVPAAVMGLPLSMLQRAKRPTAPVIECKYNIVISYDVKPKEAAKEAAKFLSACKALQAAGYSVKIVLCAYFFGDNRSNIDGVEITVKEAGEILNLNKLAYLLVNPAFFRRHCFRWIETHIKSGDRYYRTYGCTAYNYNSILSYESVRRMNVTQIIDKLKKQAK